MEASGGLQNLPAALLARAGKSVAVVNPAQVRAFAKAVNQRAKTDAVDARLIAEFGLKLQPQPRPLPEEDQALLAELLARRTQIMQTLVAESNRLQTARFKAVQQSISRHIKWLEKQLATLDADMDERIKHSPIWRAHESFLTSVPGVGTGTARVILADLPELGKLSGRQIASLAGVAPFARQSGKWEGKRFISGGRARLRSGLYMAALTASRYNPTLKVFYQRLLQQGKPPKLALTAVLRKLLTILNALIRDQKPWNEHHLST
jgi:transposase